ncbi:melatonin receptor type 1C-like [Montipora foliosa]|uniref:melatonin receptor type 1C-like n=1 Tax=Montipora foliosa TaxID=591990 RepID=UPI0035F13CF6
MTDELSSRSLFITVLEVLSIFSLNVLSLTGNTLVCIAVFKNVRLRSTTNLYIVALALSDLLSAIFVMPFVCGVLVASKWVFGDVVCHFHAFFGLFAIYVSPVTMGMTAVNRYVRMCKPDEIYRRWFSKRKSIAFLTSAWIVVACYIAVPWFAGLQEHRFIPEYAQCSIEHHSYAGKMIHYCIVLVLFFLTPLITTVFCYRKVSKMIRQHNENASTNIQQGVNTGIRHEINISKSLFAVVFAFMVCWVPFWIIVILRRFFFVEKMPRNVELVCKFLVYFSNTINPFVYAGMNSAFRREFRKLLLCKRFCKDIIVPGREGANKEEVNTHSNVSDKTQVGQTTPL